MSEIVVNVREEQDLYEGFDARQLTFRSAFVSFMKEQLEEHRGPEALVIRFVSKVPLDEEKLRKCMEQYVKRELERNRITRRKNRLQELYLMLIGVGCLALGIALSNLGPIYLQILSLTAGFAIKEAATIFFMKNPGNTLERARILSLMHSRLAFLREEERENSDGRA